MTRILSVVTTTARRGAETFAVDLGAALSTRGVDVEVVALTPSGAANELPLQTLGPSRTSARTIAALRRMSRSRDVVIANGSTTLPVTALALTGTSIPFIYRNVGDPRYWAPGTWKRERTRWALRRAAAIVALTDETAHTIADHYRLDAERTWVIPKGVASVRFPRADGPTRTLRRRELGLPEGPIVVYVGALSSEKRPDLAVRAVAAMNPQAMLVFVGDGPDRERTETLATEVLAGRTRFVGQVADPSPYLQAADVLVLPSDTEGLPGVAMEAGVTGLPVVATDVGWIRDIVRHGETGLVVRPDSVADLARALEAALRDASRLGGAARRHCMAHFEIGAVADRWMEIVRTIRRS